MHSEDQDAPRDGEQARPHDPDGEKAREPARRPDAPGRGERVDGDHHKDHSQRRRSAKRRVAALAALALASLALLRTFFFVHETSYVYVTQFGEPVRLCTEPGLGIKWPFQSLWRFDRRLRMYDPPGREMLTEDKENLSVDWYVCWRLPGRSFVERDRGAAGPADEAEVRSRIERHVRQFLQAVGNADVAEQRLEERIQASLAAELGRVALSELVSVDPESVKLGSLMERVAASIRGVATDQYGIEVVDVRLKRFNYPESVKTAVFDEIRSERARVAIQYRAEGRSESIRIRSLADKHRDQILSQARSEATRIRGQGEARAIEIYNEAHGEDPEFYELLKTLETYRSMLDDKTTVVLSAKSRLLELLMRGPPKATERGETAGDGAPAKGESAPSGPLSGDGDDEKPGPAEAPQ